MEVDFSAFPSIFPVQDIPYSLLTGQKLIFFSFSKAFWPLDRTKFVLVPLWGTVLKYVFDFESAPVMSLSNKCNEYNEYWKKYWKCL